MESDPLRGLVGRALRAEVKEIAVERLATNPLEEVDRIVWSGPEGSGVLLFTRYRESAAIEAQLLPFLARRGLAVPRVVARGLPPARAPERRPWLLTEEIAGPRPSMTLNPAGARAAGETLTAIQQATAQDAPALTALGVPALPASRIREEALAAADLLDRSDVGRLRAVTDQLDAVRLESLGVALVHGDYRRETLLARDGDLVVVGWRRAHLGCPLQDLAHLLADLSTPDLVQAATTGFGRDVAGLGQAALLDRLFAMRWLAWDAREGTRPSDECAAAVRHALDIAEAA